MKGSVSVSVNSSHISSRGWKLRCMMGTVTACQRPVGANQLQALPLRTEDRHRDTFELINKPSINTRRFKLSPQTSDLQTRPQCAEDRVLGVPTSTLWAEWWADRIWSCASLLLCELTGWWRWTAGGHDPPAAVLNLTEQTKTVLRETRFFWLRWINFQLPRRFYILSSRSVEEHEEEFMLWCCVGDYFLCDRVDC